MIKIPIAIKRESEKLVNVYEVPNGLECNCYCQNCKESLVAINKEIKQKAHFRHKTNSDCEFNNNYETYIHWLVKELFKNIGSIMLPQIRSSDIKQDFNLDLHRKISNQLKKYHLPEFVNRSFNEAEDYSIVLGTEIVLQKNTSIQLTKCLTEKVYKSKFGEIRVDIALFVEDKELFIEPYFTHPIDREKLRKIKDLNISTISINLFKFIEKHDYLFTVEEVTNFLINDLYSKKWEYIRDSKVKSLITNLFENIWPNKIEGIKTLMNNNAVIQNKITDNHKKILALEQENSILSKQIKSIDISELFNT